MRRASIRKDLRAAREAAEFDGGILHFARSKSRAPDQENPDIGAQLVLHMAIRLAQKTLRAAAHGGTAQFFPGGKADLARNALLPQNIQDHAASCDSGPLLIDVLKVAATLDHLCTRQCVFFFHIAFSIHVGIFRGTTGDGLPVGEGIPFHSAPRARPEHLS